MNWVEGWLRDPGKRPCSSLLPPRKKWWRRPLNRRLSAHPTALGLVENWVVARASSHSGESQCSRAERMSRETARRWLREPLAPASPGSIASVATPGCREGLLSAPATRSAGVLRRRTRVPGWDAVPGDPLVSLLPYVRAFAKSIGVAKRSAGTFESARPTAESTWRGMDSRTARMAVGVSVMTLAMIA